MNIKKIKNIKKIAQQLGKLGGDKTRLKGREYYSKIGKLGAKKRWFKIIPRYDHS